MPQYLTGKQVKWYTDNQCVVSIVHKGSMKKHLHDLAILIYKFACQHSIDIHMEWILQGQNERADMLSRIVDRDNWQVSHALFKFLNHVWGPFTIDRFADSNNTKLNKFNSKFWSPNTSGVDVFAFNWQGEHENNRFVPPVYLISRCLRHIEHNRVNATLIVPYWPSAVFWPLLIDKNGGFQGYISRFKIFKQAQGFFIKGSVPSIFTEKYNGAVLALNFVV